MKEFRLFAIAIAAITLFLTGCAGHKEEAETKDPVFMGAPAETRINWDLAGNWTVFRFQTKEKPSNLERWEAKWILEPGEKHGWKDKNGQGTFWLSTAPVGEKKDGLQRVGDLLVWKKPDQSKMFFSVNEQSFGCLTMTGDDGEGYMAVRSD